MVAPVSLDGSWGSIAEKVARAAPVPILLTQSFRAGSESATAEELTFRKILVPVDGSQVAEAAVGPAVELATLFKSNVVVLHAEFPFIAPGPEVGTFPVAARTPAEEDDTTLRAAEAFRKAGLPLSRVTEFGEPAGVILDQGRSLGGGAHRDGDPRSLRSRPLGAGQHRRAGPSPCPCPSPSRAGRARGQAATLNHPHERGKCRAPGDSSRRALSVRLGNQGIHGGTPVALPSPKGDSP